MADNPIKEVYEKFKHFDCVLSDKEWLIESGDLRLQILYDLWQAVKEAQHVENVQIIPAERGFKGGGEMVKISLSYLVKGLRNDDKVFGSLGRDNLENRAVRLIQQSYIKDLIRRIEEHADDLVKIV